MSSIIGSIRQGLRLRALAAGVLTVALLATVACTGASVGTSAPVAAEVDRAVLTPVEIPAPPGISLPDAQAVFLSRVREQDPGLSAVPDQILIDTGINFCAGERERIQADSEESRNLFSVPNEAEVGDPSTWSVSQKAFDDLWSTPASDDSDGLQSVWTEMQEAEAFFNNFGSTPDEIISGLLANNRAAAERAEEWAKLAAKPGATAQVVKAAEELEALSAYTRNFNFDALSRYRELTESEAGRVVARVQELAGDGVDIFDRDFDKDDFYREAMLAAKEADIAAGNYMPGMTTGRGADESYLSPPFTMNAVDKFIDLSLAHLCPEND
ncbi:hypothetical protein N8342_10120 [Acidimicrobiales bacterium]|nr:hypothetical protein [Acidimicrobiales bacterium]